MELERINCYDQDWRFEACPLDIADGLRDGSIVEVRCYSVPQLPEAVWVAYSDMDGEYPIGICMGADTDWDLETVLPQLQELGLL